MKTKNLLTVAALAATLLGGCSKNDEQPATSNFPTDGVIRVATSVGDMQSRAGVTTDNINNFNLKIENPDYPTYSYYAIMRGNNTDGWNSYSATGGPATPLLMLWRNDTDKVKVTALSEYDSTTSEGGFTSGISVNVYKDQTEENKLKMSDLLYMATKEVDPKKDLTADGKLPIKFVHLLSKLNLTITLGTELNIVPGTATNPISDLKVNGTYWYAYFFPMTGVLTPITEVGVQSVQPFAGAYTAGSAADAATQTKAVARYECILLPQTVTTGVFTVSFKIDGKTYEWTSRNNVTLVSGKKHALELTVGKDVVQTGQFTSSEWVDGTVNDVVTE